MTTSNAAQESTLARFLDAWTKWDARALLTTFSDDFKQTTYPLNLGIPGRTKAEAACMLPALMATVKSYELTVHHIVRDFEDHKAAVYAASKGQLPWGDQWKMEYAAFVTFSDDGEKVAKVEEMMDSAFLNDFAPKFMEYLQCHGGPVAVAAMA